MDSVKEKSMLFKLKLGNINDLNSLNYRLKNLKGEKVELNFIDTDEILSDDNELLNKDHGSSINLPKIDEVEDRESFTEKVSSSSFSIVEREFLKAKFSEIGEKCFEMLDTHSYEDCLNLTIELGLAGIKLANIEILKQLYDLMKEKSILIDRLLEEILNTIEE
jgi:hypothetical protein